MNLKNIDYYVKMCKEATELQENHKPEIGDYYYLNWLHEAYPDFKFRSDIETYLVREAPEWAGDTLSPWAEYFDDTVDYDTNIKNSTWLPRQDQLQELLKPKHQDIHKNTVAYAKGCHPNGFICMCISNEFDKFINSELQYIDYVCFDSFEELWLAYMMYDSYGKFWNGVEWK